MQSIREIGSLHAHIGNRAADRITTWAGEGGESRRSSGDGEGGVFKYNLQNHS